MVSVVGDFNNWTGQNHMMNKSVPSGFWQLFVPDIRVNTAYKFRVQTVEGTIDRADPYGYSAEVPPKNASIITDLSEYRWKDSQWMEQRLRRDWFSEPISFYEVHLGSWKRPGDDFIAGLRTVTSRENLFLTALKWDLLIWNFYHPQNTHSLQAGATKRLAYLLQPVASERRKISCHS